MESEVIHRFFFNCLWDGKEVFIPNPHIVQWSAIVTSPFVSLLILTSVSVLGQFS